MVHDKEDYSDNQLFLYIGVALVSAILGAVLCYMAYKVIQMINVEAGLPADGLEHSVSGDKSDSSSKSSSSLSSKKKKANKKKLAKKHEKYKQRAKQDKRKKVKKQNSSVKSSI